MVTAAAHHQIHFLVFDITEAITAGRNQKPGREKWLPLHCMERDTRVMKIF